MSPTSEPELRQVKQVSAIGTPASRANLVRILFVHRSIADVERCLNELRKGRFNINSDVVVTPEQFADRLRLRLFDLIVAEYPSTNWHETQVLDLLAQLKKDIPLIFLVHGLKRETAAEFILKVLPIVSKRIILAIYPSPFIALSRKKRCATNATALKKSWDALKHVTALWQEI